MSKLNLPLVQASLAKAQSELGQNARFEDVLSRARQIAPDAFGHLFDGQAIVTASDSVTNPNLRIFRDHAKQCGLGEFDSEKEAEAALAMCGKKPPAAVSASSFEGKARALVTAGQAGTRLASQKWADVSLNKQFKL